jgi:excisionase family DNA binding protein
MKKTTKTTMTNNTENAQLPSVGAEKPAQIQPLFYDIHQAACALNLSTKSVRRLLWRGRLTSCKAVRKVLIPRKQIEDFIRASCDTPSLAA